MAYLNPLSVYKENYELNETTGKRGGGGKERRVEGDLLRIRMGVTGGHKIGNPWRKCV
jgi:hypothetical protein